ncbi:hypothetical protein SLE2022_207990 [Rubroshorea leprosula]
MFSFSSLSFHLLTPILRSTDHWLQTNEFVVEMELRFEAAFKAMEELEKGVIANRDGRRMVGHYWLRNSKLALNKFLRQQIENTLDAVCKFADEIVVGFQMKNPVLG